MVSFYSNENFPLAMVELMRSVGYDVLTSYEAGNSNQRIPDGQVLEYATQFNRVIITENRQDFIDLHYSNVFHCGIVICKADRDYEGKVQILHDFLSEDVASLDNRLLRIQKQNLKGSRPTFVIQEYFRSSDSV
jgi:predicted nuclease of predicted toxin-antitoxin system